MTPLPGPGLLMGSGAGLWVQPPAVESPLPGGVATVVRFFLNLPAWLQITGFALATILTAVLLVVLWRRRKGITAWVVARPRNVKLWLGAAGAAALLFGAGFGGVSWNYMQHDNGFCTGCHVMGPSYVRFTQSEHATLSCHDCHQQSMFASMRQLYLWVAERPAEIGPHAKVANAVCARCHVTGEREVWQRIASTAGHRTHLESQNPRLVNVQCVNCHATEVHHFAPLDKTCGQAGCHDVNQIALGKMRGQTTLHCTTCHRFTAEVPALATRDSAQGTLTPGERQCFSCHEMRQRIAGMELDPARDPHGGTCGMCHNPHRQEQPAAARGSCTQAACHADWRSEPFHTGETHRRAVTTCTTCHLPHQARVDASDCTGCHQAVRERARNPRVQPPVPFDTTRVIRGISVGPPQPLHSASFAVVVFVTPAATDTFSHDRHKALACITCHAPRQPRNRLTFQPPRGCQLCHHQAPAQAECATCHEAAERTAPETVTVRVAVEGHAPRDRAVSFTHATHGAQRCVACHMAQVTLAADPVRACASCHAEHHGAGRTCVACHGGADPRPAHASSLDTHGGCDNCHEAAVVAQLVPNRAFCATCHAERQAHYADRQCTVCHFLASPEEFRAHLREAERGGDS